MISMQTNVAQLNDALRRYKRASGKSLDEVLAKQGGKFASYLSYQFKGLTAKRGSIRDRLLRRLKQGKGIKVRDSIYEAIDKSSDLKTKRTAFKVGKKHKTVKRFRDGRILNFQAEAVRREINAREKAKGFMWLSAKWPSKNKPIKTDHIFKNKYAAALSEVFTKYGRSPRSLTFSWRGGGKLAELAKAGVNTKLHRLAISKTLQWLTYDIMKYVIDEERKAASRSGLVLR